MLGQSRATSACRRSSRSATARSIAAVWDGPIEVVDDPRQADAAFDYAACR